MHVLGAVALQDLGRPLLVRRVAHVHPEQQAQYPVTSRERLFGQGDGGDQAAERWRASSSNAE